MTITNELNITRKASTGEMVITLNGATITITKDADNRVNNLYKEMLSIPPDVRDTHWNNGISNDLKEHINQLFNTNSAEPAESEPALTGEKLVKDAICRMMDFFTEFQFEPNFRFLNTLSHALTKKSPQVSGKAYIQSYFELIDSAYKNDIAEKIKSKEFNTLLKDFASVKPNKTVNNRFKLYYGSQGTGKTTIAQQETDSRCIICNSSMLPADLMEDFDFADGKATFKKSMLWECMENGQPIVFDEINLLPFDSLRFLQGLLDNKTALNYKGQTVNIREGFQIIGTMNLTVNGMTYGLPEPLVDRCAEMKKFTLTADDLISAIM